MPITLTLGQLVNAKPALERLIAMRFSMTTSFRLSRRLRLMMEEIATFEQKHNALVTELGTPIEGKPGQIGVFQTIIDPDTKAAIPNPKWAEYATRAQELSSIEVSLAFEPIKIEDLQPIKITAEATCPKCGEKVSTEQEQTISVPDMLLLLPMLAEETTAESPKPEGLPEGGPKLAAV